MAAAPPGSIGAAACDRGRRRSSGWFGHERLEGALRPGGRIDAPGERVSRLSVDTSRPTEGMRRRDERGRRSIGRFFPIPAPALRWPDERDARAFGPGLEPSRARPVPRAPAAPGQRRRDREGRIRFEPARARAAQVPAYTCPEGPQGRRGASGSWSDAASPPTTSPSLLVPDLKRQLPRLQSQIAARARQHQTASSFHH